MLRPASTGWHRRSEPSTLPPSVRHRPGAPSPRCSRSAILQTMRRRRSTRRVCRSRSRPWWRSWPRGRRAAAWLDRRGAPAPTPHWHDPCPASRPGVAGRLVPRVADLRADVAGRGCSCGGEPGRSRPDADVDRLHRDSISDRLVRFGLVRSGLVRSDLLRSDLRRSDVVSRFDTGDGLAAGSFSHRRTTRADRHGRRAIPRYRRLPLRLRDGIDHRSRAWALPPSSRGLLSAQWAGPVRLPVTEGQRLHQRCPGAREAQGDGRIIRVRPSAGYGSGHLSKRDHLVQAVSATCSRQRHSRTPDTSSRIERRGYATLLRARTIPLENATEASVARAQVDATRTSHG